MNSPTEPLAPQAASVLRQFRMVLNTVKSHFQHIEKQVGIGGAQVWALSVVAQHPDIGTGALAKALDIHQSTASNLIKSLTSKGLITARRDEQDRRAVRLQVTPHGKELLTCAPGPWSGVLPQALSQMDTASLSRLADDLNTLTKLMGAEIDPKAARIPLAQL
jgi:DNA-binding MarR family transcriptional regulator